MLERKGRTFWEAKYAIGGFAIIALGCFEIIKSGLALYAANYGATGATKTLEGFTPLWLDRRCRNSSTIRCISNLF